MWKTWSDRRKNFPLHLAWGLRRCIIHGKKRLPDQWMKISPRHRQNDSKLDSFSTRSYLPGIVTYLIDPTYHMWWTFSLSWFKWFLGKVRLHGSTQKEIDTGKRIDWLFRRLRDSCEELDRMTDNNITYLVTLLKALIQPRLHTTVWGHPSAAAFISTPSVFDAVFSCR